MNWDERPFGELAKIAEGQVDPQKKPYCDMFHIGPENVQSGTGLISNLSLAKDLGLISGKYLFDKESIVYSKIRPNLNKICLPNFTGICSADMYPIWPKKELLDRNYLFYFMNSFLFLKPAIAASMRTGLPKINRSDLMRIKVCFPKSLMQQKVIANILSSWDATTEKIEWLIAVKEKRFLWLTRSLIGSRCEKWPSLKAEKIFTDTSEKNRPEEELLSVTQDRGVIPRSMLEGRVMSPEGSTASYKLIKKGDFVVSLRSFQGGIEYSAYQGIISPAYTVLRSKIEIDRNYFRLFFKTHIFIKKYLRIAVIGIRDGKQISIPDLMTVKIPCPPLDEQKRIATTLDTARREIDLHKNQLAALQKQKRGLMQKLLTGKWRVKASEAKEVSP